MKRVLLTVVLVASLGACGSDKPKSSETGAGTSTSTTGAEGAKSDDTPSTTAKASSGGGASGGSTSTTSGAGANAAGGTTTTVKPPVGSLAKACVRKDPAGDTQTFTVESIPGDHVSYSTSYSDGSNEYEHKEYTAGWGFAKEDGTGRFVANWTVPAGAPVGKATLHWAAQGKVRESLHFTVVAAGGRC